MTLVFLKEAMSLDNHYCLHKSPPKGEHVPLEIADTTCTPYTPYNMYSPLPSCKLSWHTLNL